MTADTSKKRKGLWAGLRSLIGVVPPSALPATAPVVVHKDEDHWVDLSLEQLLDEDSAAPVHVITLREYREALGANWGKLESKVLLLAESVIRRVTRHGGVISQKNDSFLVMFKLGNRAAGAKLIDEVASELGQRLVGAKFGAETGRRGPAVGVATVTSAELLGDDGCFDISKLETVTATATPVILLPPPERAPLSQDTPQSSVARKAGAASEEMISPQRPLDENSLPVSSAKKVQSEGKTNWQPIEDVKKPRAEVILTPMPKRPKKRPDPEWVPLRKD